MEGGGTAMPRITQEPWTEFTFIISADLSFSNLMPPEKEEVWELGFRVCNKNLIPGKNSSWSPESHSQAYFTCAKFWACWYRFRETQSVLKTPNDQSKRMITILWMTSLCEETPKPVAGLKEVRKKSFQWNWGNKKNLWLMGSWWWMIFFKWPSRSHSINSSGTVYLTHCRQADPKETLACRTNRHPQTWTSLGLKHRKLCIFIQKRLMPGNFNLVQGESYTVPASQVFDSWFY